MDKVLSTYFKKGIYQKKIKYHALIQKCNIGSYGKETKSCPNVTAFFEFYSEIQNHFGKMALVDKHHET